MQDKIIIGADKNGRPKYKCPHCGALLTIQCKSPICRKCRGKVDWSEVK